MHVLTKLMKTKIKKTLQQPRFGNLNLLCLQRNSFNFEIEINMSIFRINFDKNTRCSLLSNDVVIYKSTISNIEFILAKH